MGHTGLHNTLEAAVFSVPIIIGQNYSQFPEAKAMLELGGVFSVKDSKAFQNALDTLVDDEKVRTESGKKNREYIAQNKGATEIIFRKLKEYL